METEGLDDPTRPSRQEAADATTIASLVERTWPAARTKTARVAPGLGTRRFYRVSLEAGRDSGAVVPASLIARFDVPAPPPPADMPALASEPEMEPIRRFLEAAGLPVPQRFAEDPQHALCLVEDLGDRTLEDVAKHGTPAERQTLYLQAAALIPALQAQTSSLGALPAAHRRLDANLFESKSLKLARWALPVVRGRPTSVPEEKMLRDAFAVIARRAESAPGRLAHRDFKGQNLHVVSASGEARDARDEARARIVMIDFQGAFLAPPEYDLVCLLRDAHVALPEEEVDRVCEEIRPRLPDAPSPDAFAARFEALTLTRLSKDAAHYLHAARPDAESGAQPDERYLPLVRPAFERAARAARSLVADDAGFGPIADLLSGVDLDACSPDRLKEAIASCAP